MSASRPDGRPTSLCFSVVSRLDLRFDRPENEAAFRRSLLKHSSPWSTCSTALYAVLAGSRGLANFTKETGRSDDPFQWKAGDPRTVHFAAELAGFLLAIMLAAFGLLYTQLRLRWRRWHKLSWELLWTVVACAVLLLNFVSSMWYSGLLSLRSSADEVWSSDVYSGHTVILETALLITLGVCLGFPVRCCILWAVPAFTVTLLLVLTAIFGSPIQSPITTVFLFTVEMWFAFEGALQREQLARACWCASHLVQEIGHQREKLIVSEDDCAHDDEHDDAPTTSIPPLHALPLQPGSESVSWQFSEYSELDDEDAQEDDLEDALGEDRDTLCRSATCHASVQTSGDASDRSVGTQLTGPLEVRRCRCVGSFAPGQRRLVKKSSHDDLEPQACVDDWNAQPLPPSSLAQGIFDGRWVLNPDARHTVREWLHSFVIHGDHVIDGEGRYSTLKHNNGSTFLYGGQLRLQGGDGGSLVRRGKSGVELCFRRVNGEGLQTAASSDDDTPSLAGSPRPTGPLLPSRPRLTGHVANPRRIV